MDEMTLAERVELDKLIAISSLRHHASYAWRIDGLRDALRERIARDRRMAIVAARAHQNYVKSKDVAH